MVIFLRTSLIVIGGYLSAMALVGALASVAVLGGIDRSEAVTAAALSGFIVYLVILIWAFSVSSTLRLAAALTATTVFSISVTFLLRSGLSWH